MDKKLLAKLVAGIFGSAPFLSLVSHPALAAGTDIASAPLANRRSSDIKPNIMLVLDDSGSMQQDYMPDDAGNNDSFGPGYRSNLCNTIYYNPTPTNPSVPLSPYLVPRSDTGVNLNSGDPASFSAAYDNGFWSYDQVGVTSGVANRTNLAAEQGWGGSFPLNPSGQPAYYWRYLGTNSPSVTPTSEVCTLPSLGYGSYNTASGVCSSVTTAPYTGGTYTLVPDATTTTPTDANCAGGKLIWEKVLVSATSSQESLGTYDERLRFANWYSYYRNRMQMTKSAIGRAFLPLIGKKKYRAGLITIAPQQLDGGAVQAAVYGYDAGALYNSKFLEIRNFDTTDLATNQPFRWYNILYAQRPNGATPLREGLSRAGRYFAGQNDGPNTGMIPSNSYDPVQYACQQNFSILTTDGYWDSPAGSIGGFKVTHTSAMDNQDGNINETDAYGQGLAIGARPIYDGTATSTATTTDANNDYRNIPCDYYFQTNTLVTQSTTQNLQTTEQALQSMSQNLQTTNQALSTTNQSLQDTTQVLQTALQRLQTTNQALMTTSQRLQNTRQSAQSQMQRLQTTNQALTTTTQILLSTTQLREIRLQQQVDTLQLKRSTNQNRQNTTQALRTTRQNLKTTNQALRSTNQNRRDTTQSARSQMQRLRTTNQALRTTNQTLRNTAQVRQSMLQVLQNTSQRLQNTTQNLQNTDQATRSTSQVKSCSPNGSCTPGTAMAACTPTTEINSCVTFTTGPTLSACTPASASAGNSWITTTCAVTSTSNVPVASCAAVSASAGNSWVTTTCPTPVTTSNVPVSSCTPVSASAGNSWVTTTCPTPVTTSNVPVASCAAVSASAGNSWVTTACPAPTIATSNVPVSACSAVSGSAGNSWVTTSCSNVNANNVAVPSCAPTSASSGNSWITTTCPAPTIAASNVPVSACTATSASSGNSWVTTSCPAPTIAASNVPVSACTATSASAGNSWITTTCPSPTIATSNVGVSSCTAVAASAGNSWVTTSCSNITTSNVAVSACSITSASAGNSWVATTCPTPVTTSNVPVSACTPVSASAGNSWVTTTCPAPTIAASNVPVSSCTPVSASAGNSWITTSCPASTIAASNVPVSVCTAVGASAGNSWVTTSCSNVTTSNVGVSSCTPTSASSGNSWVTTTCPAPVVTSNVAVSACAVVSASAGNSWIATTACSAVTTGPTVISACTAIGASAGNSWVTTNCSSVILSSIAVSSCVPVAASAGNSWVTTICATATTGPIGVSSCSPVAASAGNSWVATLCATSILGNVATASCVPVSASAGNSWITTTCPAPTIAASNVPVSACTATSASAGNSWVTTTCPAPTIATSNVGVASCTAVAASAGNSWVTTGCSNITTSNVAVAACASTSASAGNSWITTTCPAPTIAASNVPVSACSPVSASAGNSWVTTACPAPTIANSNVPVSACTVTGASAGNNWVTTACPAPTINTSNVPVSACTAASASAGNSWVTSTCSNVNTSNVAVAACSITGASAGNSWVATSCPAPTIAASNVPVSACSPVSASSGNSWVTTTCPAPTIANSNVPVESCTATSASAGNNWVTTTCPAPTIATSNVPVAACNATSASAGNNWVTTTCPASSIAASNAGVSACNPTSASAGNAWVTTTCPAPIVTIDVPVSACLVTSGSAGNAWVVTTCTTSTSAATTVQSCTVILPDAGNSFISTDCAPQPGDKNQYQTQIRSRIDRYSDTVLVGSTAYPAWPAFGPWTDMTLCLPAGTNPPLPTPGQPGPTDPASPPYTSFDAACTGWPCTHVDPTASGGSSNSLADVAQYYYKTDLRPAGATGFNGLDVSTNIVPSSATDPTEGDKASWQHMTTFTMGLGVSGSFAYNKNYKTKPIGTFGTITPGKPDDDFQRIRCQDLSNATLADPNLCSNWPTPVPRDPGPPAVDAAPGTRVDDLWHAAVDGRGQYFSAADPDAVFTGLQTALLAINAQAGSGTGATTSTQDPIPGNDLTFRAGFRTVEWTGDIRAQQLYTGTNLALEGTTLPGIVWSAQDKLDGQVGSLCDNRTIHLLRMGATNNLTPFTWNSRACDGFGAPTGSAGTGLDATEQNYLGSTGPAYSAPFAMNSWSQFLDMTDGTNGVDQRALAQGANLVNFLRGQRGMEDFASGSATQLFRKRIHVLGDIVGSQPRFVRPPNAQFTDLGYALFKAKSGIVDRPTMLYAGANDGMLHAFNVGSSVSDPNGGKELWAVVPSAVLPNLYRLGDAGYAEAHSYFVDSTASTGDVYDKHKITPDTCAGATDPLVARDCWKTLLVGGLGAGGRGYYAMDVSDPANPKALWEFKWSDTCYDPSNPATHSADCHLGLTFGAPLITKLVDGTWVALVSSGMNNINSPVKAGDGQGYLYVLDAITGKILQKVGTGVGSAASSTATLSGTLTLNGSTAVSGSGTAFNSELVQGQTIIVNGQSRVVQTIGDDTHLTVSMAFSGSGPFTGTAVTGTGPADFAYINAYIENYIQNNTAERVYGGDRLGNVWRIDLMRLTDPDDPTSAAVHYDVVKLATLLDPSGNPQPISTTPQMMNIGQAKTRMVYVATGRYLGESDLSDTQVQTIYGLGENLTLRSDSAGYTSNGNSVLPTAPLTLRQQLNQVVLSTVSGDANTRQAASPVCSAAAGAAGIGCVGWYVDLPTPGERVNLDMRLVLGSLIVPSNVTNLSACDTGGNSWLNVFDAATGGEVPGSPYKAGRYMPGAVTVGISLIRTQSGRIMSILTKSDDTQQVTEVQTQQGAPLGRRSGWRDLLD